jgi:undecaprenyl-diphosphatase
MIFSELDFMELIQKLNFSEQMRIISKPFNTVSFIVIIVCLYIYNIININDIVLLVIGCSLCLGLKLLFKRKRPYHESKKIKNYSNKEHASITDIYSFPSGHTFLATLFSLIMLKKYPKEFLFNIVSVLVGFSRVFLGVHYPTDILGGMMFGFIIFNILI